MSFTNILVAYDGSELSKKALHEAISLAQQNSAKLYVVHVLQLPVLIVGEAVMTASAKRNTELNEHAQAILNEAKELVAALPEAEVSLLQGNPSIAILDYAKTAGTDLIILGRRGLGGIRELFLGSVSHNVIQQAHIPVLVIK